MGCTGETGRDGNGSWDTSPGIYQENTALGAAFATCSAAAWALEMGKPIKICPQAKRASSFLLSLPSLPAFLLLGILPSLFTRTGLLLAQLHANTTRLVSWGTILKQCAENWGN